MTGEIALRDLALSFGAKQVLRGVDLDIPAGRSTAIIGGSGTGKSVTLKCVLGILTPDRGRIAVDGENIAAARGVRRARLLDRFGMLFQGGALFDSMPVWENVAFRLLHGPPRAGGRPNRAEAKDLAVEKLRRVGLTSETADLYPAELSGGMQKRVGLARAIATEPEIIFFDEPTTGLDPIMADVIDNLIREIVVETGATAVTITHDMRSVRKIADRVAMLHDGRIRWEGPVGEIDDAQNPFLRQFVNGLAEGPITATG